MCVSHLGRPLFVFIFGSTASRCLGGAAAAAAAASAGCRFGSASGLAVELRSRLAGRELVQQLRICGSEDSMFSSSGNLAVHCTMCCRL